MIGLGLGLTSYQTEGFSPKDVQPARLELWAAFRQGLVLDGTRVVKWYDQSYKNNDLVQTTGGLEPEFIPATGDIDFDGVNDRLDLTNSLDLVQFTMFFVIDPQVETVMGVAGSASNECVRVYQGGQTDRVTIKGTAGDSDQSNLTQNIPSGMFLLTVSRDAPSSTNNVKVYFNGSEVTDTVRDSMDPVALTIAQIGTVSNNFLPFNGLINEVVIYSTLLTDAERDAVTKNIIERTS